MSGLRSIKNQLRLASHNGVFFFVSIKSNDVEIGEFLKFIDTYARQLDPAHIAIVEPIDWLHKNIHSFLSAVRSLAARTSSVAVPSAHNEAVRFSHECDVRYRYIRDTCTQWGINDPDLWLAGIKIGLADPDAPLVHLKRALTNLVEDQIQALANLIFSRMPKLEALQSEAAATVIPVSRSTGHSIEDYVPQSVLDLRTQTLLPVIRPWFEKSLSVPGDVAEFGCFKGTMSIKYAFYIRALNLPKTVFAFDTFQGFEIDDPGGGLITAGAYGANEDAYEELGKWSQVIPIVPVRGDASQTCKRLTKPLSFVWLDLDMAIFLEPVLKHILPLCGPDTVIGLDDYGRVDTPTVKPWADTIENEGLWKKLQEYPHQAFFRAGS